MRGKVIVVVLFAVFVFSANSSILDQAQEIWHGGSTGIWVEDCPGFCQTFTPGITGQLEHIELMLGISIDATDPFYPADFLIVDTNNSLPTGSTLGLVSVSNIVDGWNVVDFTSESVFLSAGTQYGLVISIDDPVFDMGDVDVKLEWEDVYAGGQGFKKLKGISNWLSYDADTVFRTYMIPEPGTFLLLGLGTVLLCKRK